MQLPKGCIESSRTCWSLAGGRHNKQTWAWMQNLYFSIREVLAMLQSMQTSGPPPGLASPAFYSNLFSLIACEISLRKPGGVLSRPSRVQQCQQATDALCAKLHWDSKDKLECLSFPCSICWQFFEVCQFSLKQICRNEEITEALRECLDVWNFDCQVNSLNPSSWLTFSASCWISMFSCLWAEHRPLSIVTKWNAIERPASFFTECSLLLMPLAWSGWVAASAGSSTGDSRERFGSRQGPELTSDAGLW